jgi:hypothetical protein
MSKLLYAPIDKAFLLGSDQIKDTQEEIAKLKKIILQSQGKETAIVKKEPDTNLNIATEAKQPPPNYQRIGPPDNVTATFSSNSNCNDDIDYSIFKVMRHPKFDEIVQNYVVMYRPEWLLRQTNYVAPVNVSRFGNFKESFGGYSTTAVTQVQRYILFFVVCVIIFLALTMFLKEKN